MTSFCIWTGNSNSYRFRSCGPAGAHCRALSVLLCCMPMLGDLLKHDTYAYTSSVSLPTGRRHRGGDCGGGEGEAVAFVAYDVSPQSGLQYTQADPRLTVCAGVRMAGVPATRATPARVRHEGQHDNHCGAEHQPQQLLQHAERRCVCPGTDNVYVFPCTHACLHAVSCHYHIERDVAHKPDMLLGHTRIHCNVKHSCF